MADDTYQALVLDERCDEVARMMTSEMGKTIGAARAEVTKCAAACRHSRPCGCRRSDR